MSTLAEADVVALACIGDDQAFEELVRRRQAAMRRLLRQLCGDRALADDLAQETFVRAWRKIRQLNSALMFGAWLRKIAIRTWLQYARRPQRARAFDCDVYELDLAIPDGADAALDRMDLERALARLPPTERTCVVLSFAEGMSHGEIAALTGWPLGTVKSNIFRGVAQMRASLENSR
jgi:RNA polymerase sigma-70 factor (ECF subfamily)